MRLFVGIFGISLLVTAQQPARDQRAIELARQIPVSMLEAGLPNQPLVQWLAEAAGAGAKIDWEVNDCGEQTGNPDLDRGRDFPLCVESVVKLADGRTASVSVAMGTFQKGISGTPSLWSIALLMGNRYETVRTLRELPARIKGPA